MGGGAFPINGKAGKYEMARARRCKGCHDRQIRIAELEAGNLQLKHSLAHHKDGYERAEKVVHVYQNQFQPTQHPIPSLLRSRTNSNADAKKEADPERKPALNLYAKAVDQFPMVAQVWKTKPRIVTKTPVSREALGSTMSYHLKSDSGHTRMQMQKGQKMMTKEDQLAAADDGKYDPSTIRAEIANLDRPQKKTSKQLNTEQRKAIPSAHTPPHSTRSSFAIHIKQEHDATEPKVKQEPYITSSQATNKASDWNEYLVERFAGIKSGL